MSNNEITTRAFNDIMTGWDIDNSNNSDEGIFFVSRFSGDNGGYAYKCFAKGNGRAVADAILMFMDSDKDVADVITKACRAYMLGKAEEKEKEEVNKP